MPSLSILGTHTYEKKPWAFLRRGSYQDVKFHSDYADRLVSSFANKIKYEYYYGNRSIYIEGIVLENSLLNKILSLPLC